MWGKIYDKLANNNDKANDVFSGKMAIAKDDNICFNTRFVIKNLAKQILKMKECIANMM